MREANAALRERFAAIFVHSPKGGSPRLDFILRERPEGAPLVSASMWAADREDPDHAELLTGWQHEDTPFQSPSSRGPFVPASSGCRRLLRAERGGSISSSG